MIRIVNLKSYVLKEGEVLVKVDRSSPLGNPYVMNGFSNSEREHVCDLYQYNYFDKIVDKTVSDSELYKFLGRKVDRESFMNELRRIYTLALQNDIALGCWCYPKRCHAESIIAFLQPYLDKARRK